MFDPVGELLERHVGAFKTINIHQKQVTRSIFGCQVDDEPEGRTCP